MRKNHIYWRKRTILTPSCFRGEAEETTRGQYCPFSELYNGFFEFLTVFHEYHILLTWLLLTLRICYPYIKLIYKLYENNSLKLCSKFFDRTSTFWDMPLYIIDKFFVLTLLKKFWPHYSSLPRWPNWLGHDLSPRRPGFDSRSLHFLLKLTRKFPKFKSVKSCQNQLNITSNQLNIM